MISMPQIQLQCDICDRSVEVEIEFTFAAGSYDRDPQEFFFDLGEWMEEHTWRRCLNKPDEIACPETRRCRMMKQKVRCVRRQGWRGRNLSIASPMR